MSHFDYRIKSEYGWMRRDFVVFVQLIFALELGKSSLKELFSYFWVNLNTLSWAKYV